MGYKYDVFLSYRRHGEWPLWVQDNFLPIFKTWLSLELGYVRIFADVHPESSAKWPLELAEALASSKVLVPLFSKQYFHSHWCQMELAHMLAREAMFSFKTINKSQRLIFPATIYSGAKLPSYVSDLSSVQLQEFTNIRMAKDSPTAEQLSLRIRDWVPDIGFAIECAPSFEPNWPNIAVDEFLELFNANAPSQPQLPSLN